MRASSLVVLLVALAAAPCAAQRSRFSFELAAGRDMDSPIFRHEVADPVVGGTSVTRLAVDDATIAGGRIGYRVAGNWVLLGEIGHGSTRYYYSQFVTSAGGLQSSEEQWGTASRTSVGVSLARRITLASLPLSVEPEVGVALRRLTVGTPGAACPPQPPSTGLVPTCFASARWERTYSVPSVGAGLGVGYAVASRVAVLVRGQYVVGRTSTREGFYDDLLPQFDYAEAPTSQTIRAAHVTVGLRVSP